MVRRRHPKKPVEEALRLAEREGFTVVQDSRGHRWGYVRCIRCSGRDLSVWSTPRVPEHMAEQVVKFVRKHWHDDDESGAKG